MPDRYRRGNALKRHVDRVETHIISAILHIDRRQDEPWPLAILDNDGQRHEVDIRPGAPPSPAQRRTPPANRRRTGQMLLYESARLAHWRPGRFKGDFYASVFVHFRPTGWALKVAQINARLPVGWDRDTGVDPALESQEVEPDSPSDARNEL